MLRKKSLIFGLVIFLFIAAMVSASFDWTITSAQTEKNVFSRAQICSPLSSDV
ncbi:MAG TPA: hypothetical protein VNI60_06495 [Pyrinomonadaceae bacterium]|nr:hypothetical protein [Pyrinomonadaceae bacterium]